LTGTDVPVVNPPDDNKPTPGGTDTPGGDNPVVNPPQYETVKVYFSSPILNVQKGMTFTGDSDDNMFVQSSTLDRWIKHYALDLLADAGTAVNSMYDGTVIEVSSSYGYGNAVKIDHGNGVIATYASLDNVTVVNGQAVLKGEKIGETSISAMYEFLDGAHLHLEVEVNGIKTDPSDFVDGKKYFEIEREVDSGGTKISDN
jgi:hypothetical protein